MSAAKKGNCGPHCVACAAGTVGDRLRTRIAAIDALLPILADGTGPCNVWYPPDTGERRALWATLRQERDRLAGMSEVLSDFCYMEGLSASPLARAAFDALHGPWNGTDYLSRPEDSRKLKVATPSPAAVARWQRERFLKDNPTKA